MLGDSGNCVIITMTSLNQVSTVDTRVPEQNSSGRYPGNIWHLSIRRLKLRRLTVTISRNLGL